MEEFVEQLVNLFALGDWGSSDMPSPKSAPKKASFGFPLNVRSFPKALCKMFPLNLPLTLGEALFGFPLNVRCLFFYSGFFLRIFFSGEKLAE